MNNNNKTDKIVLSSANFVNTKPNENFKNKEIINDTIDNSNLMARAMKSSREFDSHDTTAMEFHYVG